MLLQVTVLIEWFVTQDTFLKLLKLGVFASSVGSILFLLLQCGKHPLPPPPLPPPPLPPPPLPPAINIIYGQPLISHYYYRERAG